MLEICPYTPADEASWLRCRLLSFFDTSYFDDVRIAKPTFVNPAIELVAIEGGRVLGVIDVEVFGELATIDTIAVHPDAQRRGVATALLEAVVERLPTSVSTLDAWTREDAAAGAWYERHFVETFRYLHVYLGDGDPDDGFFTPDGLSKPVSAFMHARIESEVELRARYHRVYVCRRFTRAT